MYWILQSVDARELPTLTSFVDEILREERTLLHYIVATDTNYEEREIMSVAELLIHKFQVPKEMVRARDKDERTALHLAASRGLPWLCQYLILYYELSVDAQDRFGQNPLHLAAANRPQKHRDVIYVLLQLSKRTPVEIMNLRDGMERTPLHIAAATGFTEMVENLLHSMPENELEEYVRKADILGQTALLAAVRGGHQQTVEKLLQNRSHPLYERDGDGKTALHFAVQLEDGSTAMSVVKLLLEKSQLSPEEKPLLLWASAIGMGTADQSARSEEVRDFLYVNRLTATEDAESFLRTAATLGSTNMARELLNRGARIEDIDDSNWKESVKNRCENIDKVINHIKNIPERGTDQPATTDSLGRSDIAIGLAALFLNPYIKTPVTVGISGEWGMGKSSVMVQTEGSMLITAARQAFPDLFVPVEDFPGAERITLNKKGRRMHKKVKEAVKSLLGTDKLRDLGEDEDPLKFLLKEYRPEYDAVLKSLACMNRSDIFCTENEKPVPGGPAILTVSYNAWHYRNESEAWAGLAVKITEEMEGRMTVAQNLRTRYRYAWKTQRSRIYLELILPLLLAMIIAGCVAWTAWMLLFRSNRKELQGLKYGSVPATLTVLVWVTVKSVMSVLKPIGNQMSGYITSSDHSGHLGYQQRVIDDITFLNKEIGQKPNMFFSFVAGEWCRNWFGLCHNNVEDTDFPKMNPASNDNLRIIVFVDDLDRCHDKIILKVLSAINLVLASCKISVILGIDKKMIERAIRKEFKNTGERDNLEDFADNYIRKIIQLPLALPDPDNTESTSFLHWHLRPSDRVDAGQGSRESSYHSQGRSRSNESRAVASTSNPARNESRDVPLTRQILMPHYSISEWKAFDFLRIYATDKQKLPREWKRLLNYHRLVWNILVTKSIEMRTILPAGWQVQLVVWVFVCWQWKDQLNSIIRNWQKDLVNVTKSELETTNIGPSLREIVEYYVDKWWPRKQNPVIKDVELQNGSSRETDKIAKQMEEEREKRGWLKLREVLRKYDVSMDCIQEFQRFRFHCETEHLPWPLASVVASRET